MKTLVKNHRVVTWPMISQVIRKKRNKAAIREEYINLLIRLIILAIIGYLVFTQVFLITRATGNEMFPSVKDGDLVIGFRLQQDYEKNDLITYRIEGERKVGRYLAQGSDVVTIDENGILYVNSAVQSGEIMYPTYAREGIEYPYGVPEGHVFVLGDYRTQAEDSRDFGAIPMDDVEGKVITILRRRGL